MSNVLAKTEQLFAAIKNRQYHVAENLLKDGANPNRLLLNGVTPFHLAVAAESTSSFEYVKLLLSYSGNPNVCDADGITPLHVAAQWDKADCLALLLQNGADLSLCDKEGRDINWFAKESEHCKFIVDEYTAALNESSDVDLSFVTSYSEMTPPATKVHKKAPLQEIDNNQLLVRGHHKNQSRTNFQRKEEQCYNSESLHSSQSKSESGKYIMDATSPDHCFFIFKSDESLNKDRKWLHDTLVIGNNKAKYAKDLSDLSLSENSTPIAKTNAKNEIFNDNENVYSTISSDSRISEVCDCYDLSKGFTSNKIASSECNTSTLPQNTNETAKCATPVHSQLSELVVTDNCDTQCVSDDMCRNMLLGTKAAIGSVQNNRSANCCVNPHTSYETLPTIDSICTFADSTVPVSDGAISIDFENKEDIPRTDEDSNCEGVELFVSSQTKISRSHLRCPNDSIPPIKLSLSTSINESNDDTMRYDWQSLVDHSSFEEVNSSISDCVVVPSHIENMDDKMLRAELLKHNYAPGPICHGRKQYKKQLCLLEQGLKTQSSTGPHFSRELTLVLMGNSLPRSVVADDETVRSEFDDPSQSGRGGSVKDSFNYLLLDPRITQNLPERAKTLSEAEALKVFAGATFYVGKGKKARPYAHLKEAIRDKTSKSQKIMHIHDIWKTEGVVSLHLFQNVLASEAFTREAAMIEALGLDHLTNHMKGKCYGAAQTWDSCRFRQYGSFLIIRAMQMLLLEGERHIRPHQISKNIDRTLKF